MGYSSLQLQLITLVALLFTIVCFKLFMTKSKKTHNNNKTSPPEPAGEWPFVGHLPLLGGDNLLHHTLSAMADTYGPTFCVRLGNQKALVISSWDVAKECFTANDKVFATRPRSLALKLMAYDHQVLGFSPYGDYWREIRKIVMIELLSSHRLEMLKHVRDSEVNLTMRDLYEKWLGNGGEKPVLVEMKEKFTELAMNVILRIVAGKRYGGGRGKEEELREFQNAMVKFMYFVGLRMVSDAIPMLGWVDVVNGYVGKMKRFAREMDVVLGRWVEEHKRKRAAGEMKEGEKDFIDVMLSVLEDNKLISDADTTIKATCWSMILGGNDTTSVTLSWALSFLLNNRHVLKKARDELDFHVGKHRQVKESDVKNLTYLNAIVKETLRLYPALPLSVAHEAMEDCTVDGFHIPAGTHLYANLYKLHRDPKIWSNPLDFEPERFLTDQKNLDLRGQHYEFIPFGSGRRMCPGVTFALQVLHLTLARLLHGFDLGTVSDLPVDMTESPGLSVPKANPLEVLFTPRLSPELYNY